MNIAMLHTARGYKYAYINILWVFTYFNCHAPPPLSIRSLYIFEGINQLQSTASLLAQNTCHTSCKCQTHVEGANTDKQYEKLMKTQNENKSESKRSKTCETQTGNMPRSEKNLCRTLQKNKKKWAAKRRQRWRSVCYFRLILHTNDLAAFAAAEWRIFHIAEIFARGMQQMVLKPGKIAHTRRLHTRQQLPQLPFDGSLKFLLRCCCSVNRFQSAKPNTINRIQVPAASQNE